MQIRVRSVFQLPVLLSGLGLACARGDVPREVGSVVGNTSSTPVVKTATAGVPTTASTVQVAQTATAPSAKQTSSAGPSVGPVSSAAPSVMQASSAAPSALPVPLGGSGCKAAAYCDDFEQATPGKEPGAPWVTSTNSGAVAVSGEQAKSGTKSVHFTGELSNYARAYLGLKGDKFPASISQEMFGRFWILPKKLPKDVHWTIVQAEGPSVDSSYRAFYRYGGQTGDGELLANYETEGKSTDCWQHSKTKLTATWACVEWRYSIATSEMQLWIDGKEISDMHVVGKGEGCVNDDLKGQWVAPKQFDAVYIGWEHYFNEDVGPFDVYIDDVAIGAQRVGCTN